VPWNINLLENKIIELTYSGSISPQELKEAFDASLLLAEKEKILLFLADCTNMIGGHSVVDLYSIITLLESTGLSRRIKEALLLPSLRSSVAEVKFYETACLNRGFNVKIFLNREDALAWLEQ
jgi:hypothetical protein